MERCKAIFSRSSCGNLAQSNDPRIFFDSVRGGPILRRMRLVNVELDKRSYAIEVGRGVLENLGAACGAFGFASRCAILTDSNVGPLFGEKVAGRLAAAGFDPITITVPAGEKSKSMANVESCYDQLAAHRMERRSFVVALGGGVVGDLAGFVAASYLRGIPFVQIPTTLLAQVDSSVGGKVGVNLKAGKNLVGAFYQPKLVLCDLEAFDTLPEREFRAGLAEVIKYGIIRDAGLFEQLERELPKVLARDPALLADIVARCCEIKADVVSQDETETGPRAILNYGHTIGHALEALSSYGAYLHGEAISIGQVMASHISMKQTGLPESEFERIKRLFQQAGLPTTVSLGPEQREALFRAMRLDKKVSNGRVKFVLARGIGRVEHGLEVEESLILEALDAAGA